MELVGRQMQKGVSYNNRQARSRIWRPRIIESQRVNITSKSQHELSMSLIYKFPIFAPHFYIILINESF